ncbi:rhodanese-like domain-containing protein [Methylopila sp. 73B]|uniref:oxygen-dependent tRNA uridine(34) hydroxylase TrhO n=1 Tax=Methylopila sp. 73B TaxID=1120792 RepID=UPI000378A478|nr:rhodanese-like domain-containing protein [Methylopila sp. 73B]
MSYAVAALYRFTSLPDAAALQAPLRALCEAHDVKGTILLAQEGVNGTVAAPPASLEAFLAELRGGPLFAGRLDGLELKLSTAAKAPFGRLKVKVKREIVTLGDPAADPSVQTGVHVAPSDWNALIARDDVVVVDVRNAFEVEMGSFEGAIDPRTRRFSDFKAFAAERLGDARGRTIAMFCTGGIRCEKASAHLLAQGFSDVRQLKGGVLKYLEEVPSAESLWRGTCFVFDDRIALGHGLAEIPPEETTP